MDRYHVFVIGADDFNMAAIQSLPVARECEFHRVLSYEECQRPDLYPLEELLDRATRILQEFPERIDGIVGWWDMPISALVPLLAERFNVPAPSLQSVLASEHKYWSRVLQKRAGVPGVPEFRLVDPFEGERFPSVDLAYPFWIKPVKGFQSHLGFRVESDADFERAIREIRAGIGRLAEPFGDLLRHVALPPEVRHATSYHCVAEQLVDGRQCTAEGYVYGGEPTVYGIIDSIRYEGVSSFGRYQYPSLLPEPVQRRIRESAAQVARAVGLEHGTFNIEFFWDEQRQVPWVIEINPRISQSHAQLFERVDGVSHQAVAIDLALGREPQWQPGRGEVRYAAKCFVRTFKDGVVTRAPSDREIEAIQQQIPGTIIRPTVRLGQQLADIRDEDSYSYTLAMIYLGADSPEQLLQRYEQCIEALSFEISGEPVAGLQPVS